jgi:hypothetical protein
MSDSLHRLESELAAMRPRPMPSALVERIEAGLAEPTESVIANPWPDRFLLSAIGSGALAACVIVGLLLAPQSHNAFPSPPPVVAKTAASDPPRVGDFSLAAVARAEFDL